MDKVEDIRRKPEHIRMRYVWFFVAVSMLFVIILWIFSLQASRDDSESAPSDSNLFNSDILNQFGEQKKALDDSREKVQDAFSAPKTPATESNNQNEVNLNNGTGQ